MPPHPGADVPPSPLVPDRGHHRHRGQSDGEGGAGGAGAERGAQVSGVSGYGAVQQDGLAEPVIDDAEPGVNITLKCGVDPSKINQYAHARVSWYRQEPDGRIQIVTYLSTGYLKNGRYSGGIDNKNGQYNLTITGLRRNDSAVYFCIARAAALQFVPGSSTKLVVSDPLTVPSVELYSPGLLEGDTDWTEPVPVMCLARDTSPGRHRVLWTIGAEAPAPGSAEEGEIEPDGSYTVRSYVTISANQWNSGAVKCEVYKVKNVTQKASASLRSQGELRS
ncbi:UNVERIFIED_CONTAM: hypothetical protein FKN15_063076 [Acipenser sinensis]